MEIHAPLGITSRLCPGVRIGKREISIAYFDKKQTNGRQRYRWFIDELEGNDLCSGVGGGTLQEGLESLLSFLGAFAEAVSYQRGSVGESENTDLFPLQLAEWATENSAEIGMLGYELQENPSLIIE